MALADTWRATAINLCGFVLLALAYWALRHMSNIYAGGPGLVVALFTYAWVGIAIVKSVSELGRTCDNTASKIWESGAAIALPLVPLSLFWQTLSLLSKHTIVAAGTELGLVIVWGLLTFGLGIVAWLGLGSADASIYLLAGRWFTLCVLYDMQTMIHT